MRTLVVESFGALLGAVEQCATCMFRGVADASYTLIPKVGRIPPTNPERLREFERLTLDQFRRGAEPWLTWHPTSEWDWLTLAQHHGVPTRLLDWTGSPLVGAFFACESRPASDGVIYCIPSASAIPLHREDGSQPDPFEIVYPCQILPRHFSPRVSAQSSRLVVYSDPQRELAVPTARIIIRAYAKENIRQRLSFWGVTHQNLFPGLDGVGRFVCDDALFHLEYGIDRAIDEFAQTVGADEVPNWPDM
jgi:hypothetical protein